ncbi:MAG: hypothetical protein WBU20_10780, partial [Candidatus Acidiferrum sp.]
GHRVAQTGLQDSQGGVAFGNQTLQLFSSHNPSPKSVFGLAVPSPKSVSIPHSPKFILGLA